MSICRAIPVVVIEDPVGTRAFYEDFLGFRVGMEKAGYLMLVSPSEPTTHVIVAWEVEGAKAGMRCRLDETGGSVSAVRRHLDRGRGAHAHADALARGLEIVYPLTAEHWGMRRLFVREPSGTVVNLVTHIAEVT